MTISKVAQAKNSKGLEVLIKATANGPDYANIIMNAGGRKVTSFCMKTTALQSAVTTGHFGKLYSDALDEYLKVYDMGTIFKAEADRKITKLRKKIAEAEAELLG